jgi:hypothetical protein
MFALRQRLNSASVVVVAIERLSDVDRKARPEGKNPTKEARDPASSALKKPPFPFAQRDE